MVGKSLLEQLRTLSIVDCDTLDISVAKDLGPFVDCTSNQAIALSELTRVDDNGKLIYLQLIIDALKAARPYIKEPTQPVEHVAVEIMMVKLSSQFIPYITGNVHVQTNPKWSYSTEKMVENAERIVQHFQTLSPSIDVSRICIKIPSTWEGLQACRILEEKGIKTLATTMFSMEQAILAADARCTYIAPYVNELRVHFDSSYHDTAKAFPFCYSAQDYFNEHNFKTKVLAASLTSIQEVMQLAGVQHITVSPPLLRELAQTASDGWEDSNVVGRVFDTVTPDAIVNLDGSKKNGGWKMSSSKIEGIDNIIPTSDNINIEKEVSMNSASALSDEASWRLAFTRSQGGRNENKLIQAINIFADMQDQLERLVRRVAREASQVILQ